MAQAPAMAVVVLLAKGKVDVSVVAADRNFTAADVKSVLNMGVDEVTAQLVLQQLQQDSEIPPEGLPELEETNANPE